MNIHGGFVTKTKLNDFHRLLNSCHIFGVQETLLENQESFKVSKGNKARRNSGGVLLFCKENIAEGVEKQTSANKHFIWVKLKSNFFKLDKDIFLCCAYIPSTNSKYFIDGEDKVLDLLKQDIEKYSNLGNIIVFGDLNCRLEEKQEELNFIDSDCEDQDYLNTIEIPNRISQDKESNTSGNMLSEVMNANTLLTLNRRKTGDTLAKFTCHEHNGSSTVDTAITSWEIYDKVQYFKVLDPVWFSDHCPIQFSVEIDQYIFEE